MAAPAVRKAVGVASDFVRGKADKAEVIATVLAANAALAQYTPRRSPRVVAG